MCTIVHRSVTKGSWQGVPKVDFAGGVGKVSTSELALTRALPLSTRA